MIDICLQSNTEHTLSDNRGNVDDGNEFLFTK